jgi:selT/selW/selH-like putative selenoprotein
LIPGEKGIFEVSVDGKSLFSKKRSVRFPRADEIVAALAHLS